MISSGWAAVRCVWKKKCGEKFSDVEKVFLSSRQLAPSAKTGVSGAVYLRSHSADSGYRFKPLVTAK